MPDPCEHLDFHVLAEMNRVTDVEDGPVGGYHLSLKVECTGCDEPFCFRGLPPGLSHLEPTTNLDATELRVPVHPMSDPTTGIGMLGFTVQVRDD